MYTSSMFTITIPTLQQITGLVNVNQFVQSLHAEQYPTIFKTTLNEAETCSFFATLLEKPDHSLRVAIMDEQVVGYIWFTHIVKAENLFKYKREFILIHMIGVAEQFQSHGIGRTLLQTAYDKANELNIQEIQLDSWAFNQPAHQFFEKQGFILLRKQMSKQL